MHCPYCHGYEIKNEKIAVIGNGDFGFEFAKMISNWLSQVILLTNGKSTLTTEQTAKIKRHNITIIENQIQEFKHEEGRIKHIIFKDNSTTKVTAVFARPEFKQHCEVPQSLGCELTEQGYIKVDDFQKTTLSGVYASGDNTTMLRAVSAAVAAGTKAGAFINKELIDESF